jgi:hypothetical protein
MGDIASPRSASPCRNQSEHRRRPKAWSSRRATCGGATPSTVDPPSTVRRDGSAAQLGPAFPIDSRSLGCDSPRTSVVSELVGGGVLRTPRFVHDCLHVHGASFICWATAMQVVLDVQSTDLENLDPNLILVAAARKAKPLPLTVTLVRPAVDPRFELTPVTIGTNLKRSCGRRDSCLLGSSRSHPPSQPTRRGRPR